MLREKETFNRYKKRRSSKKLQEKPQRRDPSPRTDKQAIEEMMPTTTFKGRGDDPLEPSASFCFTTVSCTVLCQNKLSMPDYKSCNC